MVRVTLSEDGKLDQAVLVGTFRDLREASTALKGAGLLWRNGIIIMDDAAELAEGDVFTWSPAHGAGPAAEQGLTKKLKKRLKTMEDRFEALAEQSFKRQKYSVTDAKDIGHSILERKATVKTLQEMLGHHLIKTLPESLDDKFKKKWNNAKTEKQLQPLLVKATTAMCMEHEVLDTHEERFYKVPTAKIDIALSASKQALWATLVSALELKFLLSSTSMYKEGIGQLFDRWEKLQEAQPDREQMTSCVMGKESIQLWRFRKNCRHACTSLLPFEWDQQSQGYQALLSFVSTPASKLGFIAWQIPTSFITSTLARLQCLVQMAGRPSVRPVFEAIYGKKARHVVVKLCSQPDADKEVAVLKQISGRHGFPDLLAHGPLPAHVALQAGLSHYLVISPVGVHLGDDHSAEQVCMVMRDVATAIQQLADKELLHRDLSPGNIIIARKDGVEQGVLLDYHVAARMDEQPPGASVTGKVLYHALRLHDTLQHTVATDLESLFYTLLDVASCGQAISWRHNLTERQVYDSKFTVMFNPDKWHSALARCTAALQPLVQRLHKAVLKGSPSEYRTAPVTVAEFLTALPKPVAAQ